MNIKLMTGAADVRVKEIIKATLEANERIKSRNLINATVAEIKPKRIREQLESALRDKKVNPEYDAASLEKMVAEIKPKRVREQLESALRGKEVNSEYSDAYLRELVPEVQPVMEDALDKERTKIVATAGMLSRATGKVSDVYKGRIKFGENKAVIRKIINMGHESITDHDYLVFAIEDVSPVIEQIIIEERIVSFTIKSRREANFSEVGYYVPDFRGKDGTVLANNEELQKMYHEHMKYLFGSYSNLLGMGLKREDARFVLPYSFHSNIIMGCDAHVLKNLIVRFTKGKESKIAEVKEFGEKLYEIMREHVPYYKEIIDEATLPERDLVKDFLDEHITDTSYEVPEHVKLISCTKDPDREILISTLMRAYEYPYEKAERVYEQVFANDDEAKRRLMRTILNNGGKEFDQVSFRFNVPVSLAVLTHLTRHRTHSIMVPDFTPIRDLTKYRVPPTLNDESKAKFAEVYQRNQDLYLKFREAGVCDEDLVYFHLAGEMINISTNMDGKTLAHILRLRTCNKAQWEVRGIANEMRKLVRQVSPIFGECLGPDCEVFLECHEGLESCGKVKAIRQKAGLD